MYQEQFMQRALALSAQALAEPGTEPFGAVVVKDGAIVGEGFNHSVAHSDPTSHGEVEAIRDACRKLGTVSLAGCQLYTSCEPCAMCAAAMHIAGIGQLYYAASLAQSGEAFDGVSGRRATRSMSRRCARRLAQSWTSARCLPSRNWPTRRCASCRTGPRRAAHAEA
jgi:guanine deaminase